jgi:hypothetical protein
MPATWRREDIGYAAAAAAAVAFVAYLVFGNFGLVPSPLAPAGIDDEVLVATQAVQELQQAGEDDEAPVVVPPVARPARSAPPAVPIAPKPPARDAQAPTAAITTPNGTKLTIAQGAVVEGTTADAGSGISKLNVIFTPQSSSPQTVAAALECRPGRHDCTWSAKAPGVLGDYTVVAESFDRDGNTASSKPIEITLVNVGGPVEDSTDAVGGTVGGLTRTVGDLLRGL